MKSLRDQLCEWKKQSKYVKKKNMKKRKEKLSTREMGRNRFCYEHRRGAFRQK